MRLLNQEDDLLLQSYFSFVLLAELRNNNFLESEYFRDMTFGSSWIKDELSKIGIDNQGSALIALYVMLAIPRELVFDKYPLHVGDICEFLRTHTRNTSSSYKTDKRNVEFLRHIRNAVSHARVDFVPKQVVVFTDSNSRTGELFRTELPLEHLGEFIQRLQTIHLKYIQDLQQSQL